MERLVSEIRRPLPGELPQLKKLYRRCFPDPPGVVDSFFAQVFRPEEALAVLVDGEIAAAGYAISGLQLRRHGAALPCRYLYGMGTAPQYRGQGLGSQLVRSLVRKCSARGEHLLLLPAKQELYAWYRTAAGAHPATTVSAGSCTASALPPAALSAVPLEAADYAVLRERLLRDVPHVSLPPQLWQWQQTLCRLSQGSLLMLGDGIGCAVCERDGSTLLIRELVCPGLPVGAALAAAASALPAERYEYRTPAGSDVPGSPFVCSAPATEPGSPVWFGPAFD